MPALAIECINSWKIHLHDYDIRLWNEDNFDIDSVFYVKEAYEARKFAFVTDYVRLYALYHFGGIYMDTDMEVIKSLDDLLHLPAFSGFESGKDIPTGIIASEKGGYWAKEQLGYYKDRHFVLPDGTLDMTTNVQIISGIMLSSGFVLRNSYQIYKDCIHIFPKDYFCPMSRTGVITITPNTYCIHHFAGSWQSKKNRLKKFFFRNILGAKLTDYLVRLRRVVLKKH